MELGGKVSSIFSGIFTASMLQKGLTATGINIMYVCVYVIVCVCVCVCVCVKEREREREQGRQSILQTNLRQTVECNGKY